MNKIYGFTGTRTGLNINQKTTIINLLTDELNKGFNIEVHHGDCVGADKDFHDICEKLNIKIVIHPPNDDKLRAFCQSLKIKSPKPYLNRNRDIVDESNILIGCPLSNVEIIHSGTWYTIRYARKVNKETLIIV